MILSLVILYSSKLNRATQALLQTLIVSLRFQRKNQKPNIILLLGALANNIPYKWYVKMKTILVYNQVLSHWAISKTHTKQISKQSKPLVLLHLVSSQAQT